MYAEKVHSLEYTRTEGSSYDDGNQSSQQSNNNPVNTNTKAQAQRPEPDFINDDVPF